MLDSLTSDFNWAGLRVDKKFDVFSSNGELLTLDPENDFSQIVSLDSLCVCHHVSVQPLLGHMEKAPGDILELFVFAYPSVFSVPTIEGLLKALDLHGQGHLGLDLHLIAMTCLQRIQANPSRKWLQSLANILLHARWYWAKPVAHALDIDLTSLPLTDQQNNILLDGLSIWKTLPEWEDAPKRAKAGNKSLNVEQAQQMLLRVTSHLGEKRKQQYEYTGVIAHAFNAQLPEHPTGFAIVQGETGIGKTLGYLAPAIAWADQNQGSIWLSTFTKHLQRQLIDELRRIFPDEATYNQRVAMRKGRENYLCLLNLEEKINESLSNPHKLIALVLVVRWLAQEKKGDLTDGSFPSWLVELFGAPTTIGLGDKRGECIHSACPHWRKCFIEHNQRKAHHADFIVVNHALLIEEFSYGHDAYPERIILDEGHHIMQAADSAFSIDLSGKEGVFLRRWIFGAGSRKYARGLRRRLDGLITTYEDEILLSNFLLSVNMLPDIGWMERMHHGKFTGTYEAFLLEVRKYLYHCNQHQHSEYDLESSCETTSDGIKSTALALYQAFEEVLDHAFKLEAMLIQKNTEASLDNMSVGLDVDTKKTIGDTFKKNMAQSLSSVEKKRANFMATSFKERVINRLVNWQSMLHGLLNEDDDQVEQKFHDQFILNRYIGNNNAIKDSDVAYQRYWINPLEPFADRVWSNVSGAAITSATLMDRSIEAQESQINSSTQETMAWDDVYKRTGLDRIEGDIKRACFSTPFHYKKQAQIYIISDLNTSESVLIARALTHLFDACDGGGLALFTAIQKLRQVHKHLAPRMQVANRKLLAQHVDPFSLPSLIDIFKADEQSCLIGTDALRDGVDIPGKALRLVCFDRCPLGKK